MCDFIRSFWRFWEFMRREYFDVVIFSGLFLVFVVKVNLLWIKVM